MKGALAMADMNQTNAHLLVCQQIGELVLQTISQRVEIELLKKKVVLLQDKLGTYQAQEAEDKS
jgi:hypothetical protein